MKNFFMIFLLSVFFISCSHKEREVHINYPSINIKTLKKNNPSIFETIEGLDNEDFVKEIKSEELKAEGSFKVAIFYPSLVMGEYAKSAIRTLVGFCSYKDINFKIKTFDSLRENSQSIKKVFEDIKKQGFTKIIALFSPNAVEFLNELDTDDLEIYLPLINKHNIVDLKENFIYGGIPYIEQIKTLYSYSNTNNVLLTQDSYLGNILRGKFESVLEEIRIIKTIKNERNYFKGIVKDYRLKNSSLFLNTNVVKTSILLSQLRAYEVQPKVILSTQQNYNPKILILTQKEDRKNFVVASSISKVDDKLEDIISTFGGDIKYNWVDYSVLVGVNYLFDKNESYLMKNNIEDNQVVYNVKLYKVMDYGFKEIKQDLDKIADIYDGEQN